MRKACRTVSHGIMRVVGVRNIQKGNYVEWEKVKREGRKFCARVSRKSKAHV